MGFSAFPWLTSQPQSEATERNALFRGLRVRSQTLLFCCVRLVPRANAGQESGASFAPGLTNEKTFPTAVNYLRGHASVLSLSPGTPCWGERQVRMEGQLGRKKCRPSRGAEPSSGSPPKHTRTRTHRHTRHTYTHTRLSHAASRPMRARSRPSGPDVSVRTGRRGHRQTSVSSA